MHKWGYCIYHWEPAPHPAVPGLVPDQITLSAAILACDRGKTLVMTCVFFGCGYPLVN